MMKQISIMTLTAGILLLPIPDGVADESGSQSPLRATIRLGEQLVEKTSTHELTKKYVGNKLNCTSCHLKNGRHPKAASFIGVATAYPAWSPREQRVVTLQDRILNCFMRSQNGIRPPLGSKVSIAIATYITSLSDGQPIAQNGKKPLGPNHIQTLQLESREPDLTTGAKLYSSKCADCHSGDGSGTDDGPPVWGNESYNSGAGLSRNDKLASWLKVAMPLGDETLSTNDAQDIAAFVNSHLRPRFLLEEHLPSEARMGVYNGVGSE